MTYVRARAGYWYCYTPGGRLYLLSDIEQHRRSKRINSMRRSRSVIRRLGLNVS